MVFVFWGFVCDLCVFMYLKWMLDFVFDGVEYWEIFLDFVFVVLMCVELFGLFVCECCEDEMIIEYIFEYFDFYLGWM